MSRRGLTVATSMNRLPAVGFLMIGGAFVDQGTATVRPGGGRSADLLPLALAAAGLRSADLTVLVRCRAGNGQCRVPVRALSVVKRHWARTLLHDARFSTPWRGRAGKKNIIPVRRASPSLYSAHGSSLSHVPPPLLSLSQQYGWGCGRSSRRGGPGMAASTQMEPARRPERPPTWRRNGADGLWSQAARRGSAGTGSGGSSVDGEVDYHRSSLSLALILRWSSDLPVLSQARASSTPSVEATSPTSALQSSRARPRRKV